MLIRLPKLIYLIGIMVYRMTGQEAFNGIGSDPSKFFLKKINLLKNKFSYVFYTKLREIATGFHMSPNHTVWFKNIQPGNLEYQAISNMKWRKNIG